jgi:hypothetical protein
MNKFIDHSIVVVKTVCMIVGGVATYTIFKTMDDKNYRKKFYDDCDKFFDEKSE